MEHIEADIRRQISYCSVFTHVEPLDDPRAREDQFWVLGNMK